MCQPKKRHHHHEDEEPEEGPLEIMDPDAELVEEEKAWKRWLKTLGRRRKHPEKE